MSAVLALLLAAALPLADDAAFAEGKDLYGRFEYEQATFRFERAALEKDRAPAERARVFAWLGLAYAGLGRFVDAERSFVDALRLDRAVALETEVSPKVREIFASAQARVDAEQAPAAPGEPPPPVAADDGPPLLLIGGGVAAGLGVVALAGAGVLGVLAAGNVAIAQDPDQFQDDAKAALDAANLQIAGAVVAGGVGVLLVAAGVGLVVVDLLE